MKEDTVNCPFCGADIPAGAIACPHCGSDEETGWSPETEYDGLDIPQGYADDDPDGFEYEEYIRGESAEEEGLLGWLPFLIATILAFLILARIL